MTVPNVRDKKPVAASPSELNPLTNPILEQNLGRWAKVYFSNPPAKREQAVNDLLMEIQRETRAGAATQSARPYFATDTKFLRNVCSTCQHQNPPGHKFCSRCGQVLAAGKPSTESPGTTRILETDPPNFANDSEWQRNQAFASLDDYDAPRSRGWKYLVGAAVIVLACVAYMRWAPKPAASVTTPTVPHATAPVAFPQESSPPAAAKVPEKTTAETTTAEKTTSETKTPPIAVAPKSVAAAPVAPEARALQDQKPSATAEARHRKVLPAGVQPAVRRFPMSDATTAPQASLEQDSGSPDLRLAQRYLGGSMGVRDSAEAAKLLWKAVGKQNATAAVLLSELYQRGDGVPRSCDQARLLLVAAAKRGSPLAAQQLRNLELQGCR